MKKNNLLQGAIVALLIASPFATNAGTQYPAADFQPKVLYQDASVKSAPDTTYAVKPVPVDDKKYPAADFQPKVVFEASSSSSSVNTSSSVKEVDAKYPAANFEPKVLFSDETYKGSASTHSSSTIASSTQRDTNEVATTAMKHQTESEDSSGLIILLAVAGAAGLLFFNKKCPMKSSTPSADTTRETGVTRYLNARVPKVSGVTKYLERTGQPTNVARYIARQSIAQKSADQDKSGRG